MLHKIFFLFILFLSCLQGHTSGIDSTSSNEVSILSYNIKMLPRVANSFLHHHPIKRARLIPAKLIENNADVIVFQEGFDELAMRIIRKKMKAVYPYRAGWKNKTGIIYRKAGGVLMLSKYPLKEIESITYSQSKGVDKVAHKGAMLVEVEHPVIKFQLLGTHMQAGGGSELKISQYKEAGELLKRHSIPGIPQFASGDFNCHKDNPGLYEPMLACMECENGEICGNLKYTTDHGINDMDKPDPNKHGVIDFILYKGNGVEPRSQTRTVQRFQEQWDKSHKDLSDHFAIELKMTF